MDEEDAINILISQTLAMMQDQSEIQQVQLALWVVYNSIYFKMTPEEILKIFEKCLRLIRGDKSWNKKG